MLYSAPGCAATTAASAPTSSLRMWRWSGRGCTVMPCAPAASAMRAKRDRSGMPLLRVFRSVAILLTFTDSLVMGRSAQSTALDGPANQLHGDGGQPPEPDDEHDA